MSLTKEKSISDQLLHSGGMLEGVPGKVNHLTYPISFGQLFVFNSECLNHYHTISKLSHMLAIIIKCYAEFVIVGVKRDCNMLEVRFEYHVFI